MLAGEYRTAGTMRFENTPESTVKGVMGKLRNIFHQPDGTTVPEMLLSYRAVRRRLPELRRNAGSKSLFEVFNIPRPHSSRSNRDRKTAPNRALESTALLDRSNEDLPKELGDALLGEFLLIAAAERLHPQRFEVQHLIVSFHRSMARDIVHNVSDAVAPERPQPHRF